MKKKMTVFILGMVMTQELTYTQAMAQVNTTTPAIIDARGGKSGSAGAQVNSYNDHGNYDINQTVTNFSQTAELALKNRNDINNSDKEYLKSIGTRIAQSMNTLIAKRRDFQALGQQASTTTTVTLNQYLAMVNEINALVDSIRVEIQSSMLISKDTLPSASIQIGNMKVDSGPGSVIDMSSALKPFLDGLDKIVDQLNNVQFKTLGHKGKYGAITANALAPDLSQFPQMTSEEVAEALAKIEQLSVVSTSTQRKQQFLADIIVDKMKVFIEQTGTEEFLRFRNENDKTYAADVYKDIERAFFMRSYLRRKYGLQIGAIQTSAYPRLPVNSEALFSKELIFPLKTALTSLKSQVARGDADLMVAYNNARQFVEQYDKKLTPIFSENAAKKRAALEEQAKKEVANTKDLSLLEKAKNEVKLRYKQAVATFASGEEIKASKPVILDDSGKDVAYNSDDTGFMARMSGVLTTMTGQVSTTQALLAMMRLVLADIREELMLSQGDWSTMQSYHFKRFMADQSQIERSVKMMCDIDPTLSANARAQAKAVTQGKVACQAAPTGLLGQMRSGGANALTTFRALIDQYDKFEMSRAIEARNLRNLVDSAIAAGVQEGDKADDSSLMDIPVPGKK